MARSGKNVENNNVVQMRRHSQPGIAVFLTLLILLYLGILAWNYFTKNHVSIYEVNTSEISDDSPAFAYIFRTEEVVTTDDAGYINYYIPEGSRIGKGDVVYTLDDDDSLRSMLTTLRNEKAVSTQIAPIREEIATFHNSFSPSNYTQLSDFHFSVNNTILEHSRGNLFRDLKKLIKNEGSNSQYRKYTAAKSGVVSYYTDGYEGLSTASITPDILEKNGTIERKQVAENGRVNAGDPAYKLVTSNDWMLFTELDDNYYETLKDESTVRVTILRDGISFNASIEHIEQNGKHLVLLTTSRYMERYINDRFLRIEFTLRQAKGLKIPNSSILEKEYFEIPSGFITNSNGKQTVIRQVHKEDGTTDVENIDIVSQYSEDDRSYIRDSRLAAGDTLMSPDGGLYTLQNKTTRTGVYSVNEGFCRFKPVDVLYHNKEYSIISDTTRDGLSAFDHIVVDPSDLNDDDFID
ncbi:MAG: hypothetical protein IKQ97_08520 [Eubacterium sp.]|nr:hypothetical protein [Eubacterium sp.]